MVLQSRVTPLNPRQTSKLNDSTLKSHVIQFAVRMDLNLMKVKEVTLQNFLAF